MSRFSPGKSLLLASLLFVQVFAVVASADDPLVPDPQNPLPDLRLVSATLSGDSVRKWFVTSLNDLPTTLAVANDGPGTASNFWIAIRDTEAAGNPSPIYCQRIDKTIPANTPNPTAATTFPVTWTIPKVGADVPVAGGTPVFAGDDDRAFSITINPQVSGDCASTHIEENRVSDPDHPQQGVTGTAADDNSLNLRLAVNRKPDLHILVQSVGGLDQPSETLKWCSSEIPTTCTTRVGSGAGEFPNATAYAEETFTHFQINVVNGLPSQTSRAYWEQVYQANSTTLTLPGGADTGAAGTRCPNLATPGDPNPPNNKLCILYTQFRVLEDVSPDSATNPAYRLDTNVTTFGPAAANAVGSCGTLVGTACPNFDLFRKAGNFTIRATIDPANAFPDVTGVGISEDRTYMRPFQVRFVELSGAFSFARTTTILCSTLTPAQQVTTACLEPDGTPRLPADGVLKVDFSVRNNNHAGAIDMNGQGTAVVKAWILNAAGDGVDKPLNDKTITVPLAAGATQTFQYDDIPYSDDGVGQPKLRGGRVLLRAVIDMDSVTDTTDHGAYEEQCEDPAKDTVACAGWQNIVHAPMKVLDTVKPEIIRWGITKGETPTEMSLEGNFDTLSSPATVLKKAPVNFTIVVKDNDEALDAATDIIHMTFTANGVATTYTFPTGVDHTDGNFWFTYRFPEGLTATGTYSIAIDVKDSFGNAPAAAEPAKSFVLALYPIQTIVEDTGDCGETKPDSCDGIWMHKPDLLNLSNSVQTWKIRVSEADTGIPDAHCDGAQGCQVPVQGKTITIWRPDGTVRFGPASLLSDSRCSSAPGSRDPATPPATVGPCHADAFLNGDVYKLSIATDISMLGKWRSEIKLTDKAGDVRTLYWNFTIRNELPTIAILDEPENGFVIAAGQPLHITAEVTDDLTRVDVVHANWTRAGTWVNLSLAPASTDTCSGTRPLCRLFEGTFDTGWLNEIPLAGAWKLKLDAKESSGARLNASVVVDVSIVDTIAPNIEQVSASAREEEKGFPLKWETRIVDNTNWTAKLTVRNTDTGQVRFNQVEMSVPDALGVSKYESADLEIGNYTWFITAVDSVGLSVNSDPPVSLSVLSNTAPRVALTSHTIPTGADESYFSGRKPVVTALIYDNDGVAKASMGILVGEDATNLANMTESVWFRESVNPPGYILQWNDTVAAGRPHGVELIFRVTGADISTPPNVQSRDFKLVIDGVAPASTLPAVTAPKYRGAAEHVWNVTLDSLFTLDAADPTGSGHAYSEFNIVPQGAAPGTSLCPSGPALQCWAKTDAAGFRLPASLGETPGPYDVYYRATDRVGNTESQKRMSVWLDTVGPKFDATEGKYDVDVDVAKVASFTITDSGTGVEKAAIWYRVNNGDYVELPLAFDGSSGRWVASFPAVGFTHGDRIRLYVVATDFLGNSFVGPWNNPANPPFNHLVGNRRPVITLVEPTTGSTVSGPMVISWDINDPDGDDVIVSIMYTLNGTDTPHYVAQNLTKKKDSLEYDTTKLLDGAYKFDIFAFDGERLGQLSFDVTIRNARPPIDKIDRSGTPSLGQGLVLSAVVTKKDVVSVVANISLDGQRIASNVALNDLGQAGDLIAGDRIYAVTYTPDQPGRYTVEVVVKYREGGEVKDYKKVTEFSVQASSIWVLQENPLLVAAIAVFGLGVVGLAAWGLLRRWA